MTPVFVSVAVLCERVCGRSSERVLGGGEDGRTEPAVGTASQPLCVRVCVSMRACVCASMRV